MLPELNTEEARVIGCLMEKSITTPDQYPLTLNALVLACNQKSSREPVMNLTQGQVQHTVRSLQTKHFVMADENFKRGIEKYRQRFCNTRFSDLQLDAGQFAIICLLLLRGPQTPGELRARSGRLHSFADNRAVEDAVESLLKYAVEPLVQALPRTPGRRDNEYTHRFSGDIDVAAIAQQRASVASDESAAGRSGGLTSRVERLEADVAELRQQLAALAGNPRPL